MPRKGPSTMTEQDRRKQDMRKQLEILGLEVVLDVIKEKIKSPGPIPTGPISSMIVEERLKDRGLHTQTTRPGPQY